MDPQPCRQLLAQKQQFKMGFHCFDSSSDYSGSLPPPTLGHWLYASGLPKMGGTSTSLLMFVRADKVMRTRQDDVGDDILTDMKDGTLKVDPVRIKNLM